MKNKNFLVYVLIVIIAALYVVIRMPNLNPLYYDGAIFWVVLVTFLILANQILAIFKNFTVNKVFSNINGEMKEMKVSKPKKWVFVVIGIMWISIVLVSIITTPLFMSSSYKNQMPNPTIKEFSTDIQTVDVNQIPIVDKTLAKTLADKTLGSKPSLGSQVDLGEPTIQNVNGKLVWAVPLIHSGFFKWFSNMDGTPGYILVSATNDKDVTYVENYKIKYQPNSYFFDDLERKVRLSSKGIFTGITDYSFEIDDTGKPYWVVTTYKNKAVFNLPEADGIILVDAQSGNLEKYNIDNIPKWVDRVQPENFIMNQINNKGNYVHGIFNFSNKDKFKTSEGDIIVYNNGKCYLFTGITSVGADQSTIGFMMVDMVTKEPTLYQISGATEMAAMQSAQGAVQDLGYQATFPIIININKQPTYFMTLKDNEGLIKKYALVSIRNYSVVGVGDNVKQAIESYNKLMLSDDNIGDSIDGSEQNPIKNISGKIARISSEFDGKVNNYSIVLEENPNAIYIFSSNVSPELVLSQQGDLVDIEYIDITSESDSSLKVYKANKFKNKFFIKK